ncbi:hypothetical protein A1O1_08258 [Capronia coronata CBS 617.96]|uniref:Gfo/Idh/MocA-like oxidoreductase N-terminal domain-containing protein n=1 Tax=Capronia coronata CBS 617.96 TaxID=1182541 RepID=W9XSZ0_9EURO|nr:uncharacterized protein A1O1_08258 [Capronia coronata CBS 617.96]EXJ80116.1 hypothetical protein A1O1_08258 [Capronia coronata CBS 617.96]
MATRQALEGLSCADMAFRTEHIPAIQACSSLKLKAVYSRSQKSAAALVAPLEDKVDVYYDSPEDSGHSVDDLLKRDDIDAVIVAVPIPAQPALIKKAFAAGKHVLSEKPIAKDIATAKDLLESYKASSSKGYWAVGENLRFWYSVNKAAEILKGLDAELVTFRTNVNIFVDENDKFYQTSWRATPEYQGGFLLDGGVHFVAVTRYLLAALNQKPTGVSALTTLVQPMLAPVDTLHALWKVSNGRQGFFNVSFGVEFQSGFEFEIVTSKGSVLVRMTEVITTTKDDAGEKKPSTTEVPMSMGVKEEVAAFAESLEKGKLDPRLSPEEAIADLQILEAMLKSDGNIVSLV